MATHVALCSGGMDSAVSAHASIRWGPAEILVYLDTGTGLDENREYIERLADFLGVQLWTLRTNESYADRVKKHGFPGPSRHKIMYHRLKERQISKLATVCESDLHFWTGMRSLESDRRMRNVEPETEGPRWTWHAPIHAWSKADCERYIDRFGIPTNPLWKTLGRSGDCFCGCFGSPEEKLDLRAAECGYLADWIESLESETPVDGHKSRWAWGAMSDTERMATDASDDQKQMTLCSDCGLSDSS